MLINKLCNIAKDNNIDLEVLETYSKHTDITTINDQINLFQINNNKTYEIKAIKSGRCINLSTNDITNTDEIIKNINSIFELSDNDNKNRLSTGNINNSNRVNNEVDYQVVKKDLLNLYEYLKDNYKCLIAAEFAYSNHENTYNIENLNSKLYDELYYQEYGASITIGNEKCTKVTYVSMYSKEYDFNKFKDKVIDSIEKLMIKLNSDSCVTNKYNIILKNDVVADLLNAFSDMYDSKNIYLKESVLFDKFNKQVFNKSINIIEDPSSNKFIVNRLFDDEGIKTNKKELIKNGVFVKKVNNLEYAIKNNEEATGNSYGMLNMYLEPGNNSYEELVTSLKDGIIIDELMGLHSGIDLKSGNISLQAEGYEVKDGKITKGLNMIILATNIFELFNNVVNIGNDLSTSDLCVFAPSLLINDITITGKK